MNLKGLYKADEHRYDNGDALFVRCGRSGVMLAHPINQGD